MLAARAERRRLLADRRRAPPGHPRPARRARAAEPAAGPADDPAGQPGRRLRRPDRPPPPRRHGRGRPARSTRAARRRRKPGHGPSPSATESTRRKPETATRCQHPSIVETTDASQFPVLPALPRPAPRVLAPAGPDLLGLRFPHGPGRHPRPGFPEPSPGADPGRPRRRPLLERHRAGDQGAQRPRELRRELVGSAGAGTLPAVVLRIVSEAEAADRLQDGQDAALRSCRPARPPGPIATTRPGPRPPRPASRSTTSSKKPPAGQTPGPRGTIHVTEPGSRYIDFLIPGLIGVNTMGGRALGHRLPAGQLADRQAAQVLRRHADAPARLPRRDPGLAPDVPDPRPGGPFAPGSSGLRHADPRQPAPGRRWSTSSARWPSRASACWSPAGPPPPRRSAG